MKINKDEISKALDIIKGYSDKYNSIAEAETSISILNTLIENTSMEIQALRDREISLYDEIATANESTVDGVREYFKTMYENGITLK